MKEVENYVKNCIKIGNLVNGGRHHQVTGELGSVLVSETFRDFSKSQFVLHGTDALSSLNIFREGFEVGKSLGLHLGHGVYFSFADHEKGIFKAANYASKVTSITSQRKGRSVPSALIFCTISEEAMEKALIFDTFRDYISNSQQPNEKVTQAPVVIVKEMSDGMPEMVVRDPGLITLQFSASIRGLTVS